MDFKKLESRESNGGIQYMFKAPNGYGASIVCHPYSYGGTQGLWELAVLDENGDLCYDTPLTTDVIGYMEEHEVNDMLVQIANLPKKVKYNPANGIVVSIKKDTQKLYDVIKQLAVVHPSPEMDVYLLLLQNLSFMNVDCANYDAEKELQKCENILETFKKFNEYHNWRISNYVVSELEMIFMGAFQYEAGL
jgi:hypothetical protein